VLPRPGLAGEVEHRRAAGDQILDEPRPQEGGGAAGLGVGARGGLDVRIAAAAQDAEVVGDGPRVATEHLQVQVPAGARVPAHGAPERGGPRVGGDRDTAGLLPARPLDGERVVDQAIHLRRPRHARDLRDRCRRGEALLHTSQIVAEPGTAGGEVDLVAARQVEAIRGGAAAHRTGEAAPFERRHGERQERMVIGNADHPQAVPPEPQRFDTGGEGLGRRR